MVSTTWATTSPPWCATAEAVMASCLACCAVWAFCFTVAPSSSMLAAVSSRALACCSVRVDKSWLPWAISALAVATPLEPSRTFRTSRVRLPCIVCSEASSTPTSSDPVAWMGVVKSPSATFSDRATASAIGAVMRRLSHTDASSEATATTTITSTASRVDVWASAMACSVVWFSALDSASRIAASCAAALRSHPLAAASPAA